MALFLTVIANGDCFEQKSQLVDAFLQRNGLADKPKVVLSANKAFRVDITTNSKDISTQHDLDVVAEDAGDFVAVVNSYDHFKPQLCVFDMDSTLIYQEVIEMIAHYANVEPQVKEITDRAMNNEIDFQESLKLRVSLLKGLPFNELYGEICEKIKITNGVQELTRFLHNINCKTAVLSGGFEPFAQFIQKTLKLDYMKANNLEIDSQTHLLTGRVLGQIVDGQCKAETLVSLANAQETPVPIEKTMMIGDGGNDLPAMAVAGYGVAWNAKPRVQQAAPSKLNSSSLLDVCYILGYNDAEIKEILA
ncbi:Phosphoserine phosphatase [Hanseniaspora osmophila]|uniref:phosphoserine phosphatase n=1 Tax=Hanseniaspora osmophila TaxID=56408 RepID=A0A1E5R2J6_9ASCO|nr:Phosphoserine phosphatase [Hanseniaspora osmophila]